MHNNNCDGFILKRFHLILFLANRIIYKMPSIWEIGVNSDDLLSSYISLLDKEVNSKGSFQEDFEFYCSQFKILPCPFIKASSCGDDESCRVANCIVDLSSWRAMLLACSTIGSKVIDVTVHQSTITPQHISDLSKALEKSARIKIVKMQYLSLEIDESNENLFLDALTNLFNDISGIEYLSLKGNKLGDQIVKVLVTSLSKNLKLKCINLGGNDITDETAKELFKALRMNTCLRDICLTDNFISGEFLISILGPVLLGNEPATLDDDATVKTITKYIGDRNKQIKDQNKKRKKAGLPDLPEYQLPAECIVKRDGKTFIFNQSINSIDISRNPLDGEQLLALVGSIDAASATLSVSSSQMSLVCKGVLDISKDALSQLIAFQCPWIRLVFSDGNAN